MNWGDSKGLTFDRVLIVPHGPLKDFLKTADYSKIVASLSKLYVAITRAKYSVAFLYDGKLNVPSIDLYSHSTDLESISGEDNNEL